MLPCRAFVVLSVWLFVLPSESISSDNTRAWDIPRFSAEGRTLYKAASSVTPKAGTDVVVLDEEENYVFDADGKAIRTQTKAESQSRESANFPTHSAVLSHDGLGNRCKKWARACQAGAPPRAASVIGVHASQSGALFVALQPEKREHFRGTEPTIYQPKAAPRPLYIPGTKTRIPAEPVTCERICGST
jgi:hypothetical protein